ncbi:Protein PMT-1 a [Aphelenchoides avenae]|nr:Protein PMT-1 a [Aphelenchus avenae]
MALAVSAPKRDVYRTFWSRYSSQPDNKAMMLNNNADELEALDRYDILSSLPDYNGFDVVDIGAGIGRFTAEFATKARHVTSTDFIESFIEKNKERNSHFRNITYKVSDAVGLSMEDERYSAPDSLHMSGCKFSVNLVFTNWLLMYLSDEEVLHFMNNAIRWLRPGGYLHLRESCSEPSTGRSKTTMHSSAEANPTRYRFSSVYIQLLRAIRFQTADNAWWKFDVHWATSVPTYVERQSNWRQVHWLAQKVAADAGDMWTSYEQLLYKFSREWVDEQKFWDGVLDSEEACWTDKIFARALSADGLSVQIPREATVLAYNPRNLGFHVHINAHQFAQQYGWHVWTVETQPHYYRTSLTRANTVKDTRVRYGWNETLQNAFAQWESVGEGAKFEGLIATELLASVDKATVNAIPSVLVPGAELLLLEPFEDLKSFVACHKATLEERFEVVSVVEVTDEANAGIREYFAQMQLAESAPESRWLLIHARVV